MSTVKVTVDPPPGERTVTITLPESHAGALEHLLGYHVAGPHDGPQAKFADIWDSLHEAGITGAPFKANCLSTSSILQVKAAQP